MNELITKKSEAVRLRKKGYSLRRVEKELKIPRSTLSGWFRDISLSSSQKKHLHEEWQKGLAKARRKAVVWHKSQKQKRLIEAEIQAHNTLNKFDVNNKELLDLMLSVLYLGEGFKKAEETGMGNSDPLIIKTFLELLRKIYGLENKTIRCQLNLRADQNPNKEKLFWSKKLGVPMKCISSVYIDKRTLGSPTCPGYHGVCSIRCGNVAIKRKLVNLGRMFCESILRA